MPFKQISRIGLTLLLGAALIAAYDGDPLLFLNYFTNTGNVIIFAVMVGILLNYIPEKHMVFLVMIGLVINLVYINLLIDDFMIIDDIFNNRWQWAILHYVVPYVLLIDLLVLTQEAMPLKRTLFVYLWLPVLYLVYAFIYGTLTLEYAYFFLDIPTLGLSGVAIYVTGIFAFYLILGILLLTVKTRAEKKRLH